MAMRRPDRSAPGCRGDAQIADAVDFMARAFLHIQAEVKLSLSRWRPLLLAGANPQSLRYRYRFCKDYKLPKQPPWRIMVLCDFFAKAVTQRAAAPDTKCRNQREFGNNET